MKSPEIPDDESARLESLYALGVLDTAAEEVYDRVTRTAARLFDVPIALVSLVDANRQWFKSRCGLEAQETSRDISFCGHAILSDAPMVISDASKDSRFADNPLVTDEPNIRFYAGRPLRTSNGSRIGTLCLIDSKPRQFSSEDMASLNDLGAIVEDELTMHLLTILDELTGVSNRRGFNCLVAKYLNMSTRAELPLSLVCFDLDGFKGINDQFGHAAGDRALRLFARVLQDNLRESDVVARLGGDEFAALMWNTDLEMARTMLPRLREALAFEKTRDEDGIEIEFSAGIAQVPAYRPGEFEQLLEEADRQMYRDKRARAARGSEISAIAAG